MLNALPSILADACSANQLRWEQPINLRLERMRVRPRTVGKRAAPPWECDIAATRVGDELPQLSELGPGAVIGAGLRSPRRPMLYGRRNGIDYLQGTKGQDAMSQTVQSRGVGPKVVVRASRRDTLAGAFKEVCCQPGGDGVCQSQVGIDTRLLDYEDYFVRC
jgi:hypothetical protein